VLRYKDGLFLPEPGIANLDKLAREAKADELFPVRESCTLVPRRALIGTNSDRRAFFGPGR
jgi:hypothetical protein